MQVIITPPELNDTQYLNDDNDESPRRNDNLLFLVKSIGNTKPVI